MVVTGGSDKVKGAFSLGEFWVYCRPTILYGLVKEEQAVT
jgi:hypothetical protein